MSNHLGINAPKTRALRYAVVLGLIAGSSYAGYRVLGRRPIGAVLGLGGLFVAGYIKSDILPQVQALWPQAVRDSRGLFTYHPASYSLFGGSTPPRLESNNYWDKNGTQDRWFWTGWGWEKEGRGLMSEWSTPR